MKSRNSEVFGDFIESEKEEKLKIITRFPEKWILIDTENNQLYRGTKNKEITKIWKPIISNEIIEKVKFLITKKLLNHQ